MGLSKIDFMEVRLRAEMSEETFSAIPEHLRDEMKIKSIEAANFKEAYKKCEQWRKFNILVGDAMQARSEWEARIRIENKQ
jgi:hypothetical protein